MHPRCDGPARLDAYDDAGGDVGIRTGADQGAEVEFEVFAELQATVGVRKGEIPLILFATGFGCRFERSSSGRMPRGCECLRAVFRGIQKTDSVPSLPLFVFNVVNVHVIAFAD